MNKKIGLFIDQANVWDSQKKIGFNIDYEKLIIFIQKESNGVVIHKNIYFAYPDQSTRDYNVDGIHKFGLVLQDRLGFKVTKKPLKQIKQFDSNDKVILDNGEPLCIEKGNLDIELTMDIMLLYNSFDILFLMSGDSDFLPLISFLQNKGKFVYVISTDGNISTELRFSSNKYIDLKNIAEVYRDKLLPRKNNKP